MKNQGGISKRGELFSMTQEMSYDIITSIQEWKSLLRVLNVKCSPFQFPVNAFLKAKRRSLIFYIPCSSTGRVDPAAGQDNYCN